MVGQVCVSPTDRKGLCSCVVSLRMASRRKRRVKVVEAVPFLVKWVL